MNRLRHDGPLVVGGGLAGLSAALEAARAGAKVLVVTPEPLLNACSSAWAQGGMAAALTAADSPDLHARDTLAAGAGLVVTLQNYLATSDFPVTIITGLVFMVCVLLFRRGIIGEFYASRIGRSLGFKAEN